MKFLICLSLCLFYLSLISSFNHFGSKKFLFRRSVKVDPLNADGLIEDETTELENYGAIYINPKGKYFLTSTQLENNAQNKVIAECFFSRVINEKGWNKLSINTYNSADPYQQAYMAGYLEGRMTSDDIYNFYNNLKVNILLKSRNSYKKMHDFFSNVADNFSNKKKEIKTNHLKMDPESKIFWSRVILGYTQLEGLIKGYNFEINRKGEFEEKKMTVADFLILQADGEVPELLRYFKSQYALRHNVKIGDENYFRDAFGINTKDPKEFWSKLMWTSKCSAFMKLTKDKNGNWEDLLAGHTTWTEYFEMLRTYKQ